MDGKTMYGVMREYYEEGGAVEFFHKFDEKWMSCIGKPSWSLNTTYRIKPKLKEVCWTWEDIMNNVDGW